MNFRIKSFWVEMKTLTVLYNFFTESVPRLIQSISYDDHGCVCVSVPSAGNPEPKNCKTKKPFFGRFGQIEVLNIHFFVNKPFPQDLNPQKRKIPNLLTCADSGTNTK